MAANQYLVHNLVSDLPGLADHTDKNLVNPWGNGFSAADPFWIGDYGTGLSTVYDGTGTPSATVVAVPPAGGATTPGPVTGVISNGVATAFLITTGRQAQFIFCTEDGTISGWNGTLDAKNAKVVVDNSKTGAFYKGCATGGPATGPSLYAANFGNARIDVFDQTFAPVTTTGGFADPAIPAGFAPFNIQNIGGKLYVAYAKQSANKRFDAFGAGNGYVAIFDLTGTLIQNLVAQGPLNSPWGMAIAPATFGDFGGAFLVGNFGDGKINAFNATTGASLGVLKDVEGNPIVIPGLWSTNFGNTGKAVDTNTLYFTAGIGGGPNNDPIQSHGLLGSIQAAPSFTSAGVINSAGLTAAIAPNTWVAVKGGALAATTRSWQAADFIENRLPTQLDGVGVTINGAPAYIDYVSPTQVNFLVPARRPVATVPIVVTNHGLVSAAVNATIQPVAPAFFTIGTNAAAGNLYILAEHSDYSIAAPAALVTGLTSTPFKAGETMMLFGTGFGATIPNAPVGLLASGLFSVAATPTVTVGGQTATVTSATLIGPGLFQLNVVLPAGLTTGNSAASVDVPVIVTSGGVQTQAKGVVAVAGGQ